jgi:hypothetical protein
MEECFPYKEEVVGSNPITPTNIWGKRATAERIPLLVQFTPKKIFTWFLSSNGRALA